MTLLKLLLRSQLSYNVPLQCKVKNTSQYVFLPGPSSVFMDNNFVCKSSMPVRP